MRALSLNASRSTADKAEWNQRANNLTKRLARLYRRFGRSASLVAVRKGTVARTSRKQEEVDETRTRILAAAARVFAVSGFEASTMQAIAEAAEYSAPALYNYFDGKQAILDGLVEQIRGDLEQLFAFEMAAELSLPQRVELLVRHRNAWLLRHRDALVFMKQHLGSPQPSPKASASRSAVASLSDVPGEMLRKLAQWLSDNARPGELHGRDPTDAACVLSGIQNAFFERWLREGAQESLDAKLSLVVDTFFFGLRGSNASPA